MELINGAIYILAVGQIFAICRQNPRRIKTIKFDEDDYLINGILFGALANDSCLYLNFIFLYVLNRFKIGTLSLKEVNSLIVITFSVFNKTQQNH